MILIWLGITPKTEGNRKKLDRGLSVLVGDDPALAVRRLPNGMVMLGTGSEEQLDAAISRLAHRFNVEAAISAPQVAYHEALTRDAEGESKYAVQSGGRGEYAHVKIRVEPANPGSGLVFENDIFGGAIPPEMIPAVEQGVSEALDHGVLAGYPLEDVRVTLYDGSYHDVDSSAAAFKVAGSLALRAAAHKAKPVLLEPIMNVSVVAPTDCGRVIVDGLRLRRGEVHFSESTIGSDTITVVGWVPLSEMFGYSIELRHRTGGRGTSTVTFSHYAPVTHADDDGDRAAGVRSPLRPRKPQPTLRASVPEPPA